MKQKMSLIKVLKRTGASIDPWGTPVYISENKLHTEPILTHCFLLLK
jgi:hypothetical protein